MTEACGTSRKPMFDTWHANVARSPACGRLSREALGLPEHAASNSLLPWSALDEIAEALRLAPARSWLIWPAATEAMAGRSLVARPPGSSGSTFPRWPSPARPGPVNPDASRASPRRTSPRPACATTMSTRWTRSSAATRRSRSCGSAAASWSPAGAWRSRPGPGPRRGRFHRRRGRGPARLARDRARPVGSRPPRRAGRRPRPLRVPGGSVGHPPRPREPPPRPRDRDRLTGDAGDDFADGEHGNGLSGAVVLGDDCGLLSAQFRVGVSRCKFAFHVQQLI